MKRYPLPFYTDILLTFVSVFLLIFAFLPKRLSINGIFILSISFSLSITLISVIFLKKKYLKKQITGSKKEEFDDTMTALNLLNKEKLTEFFYGVLSFFDKKCKVLSNAIDMPQKKLTVFFKYKFDKLKKSDIVSVYNFLDKDRTAIIFANDFGSEEIEFANRFNNKIILYDNVKTFQIIKKANASISSPEAFRSSAKKPRFNFSVSKKRAKTFFVFGVSFLLLSFFVPFRIYYLITGGIFVGISLLIRLFFKTEENQNSIW